MDTTTATFRVRPSGWYADPTDQDKLRWWDGQGWSGFTKPKEEELYPRPAATIELQGRAQSVELTGKPVAAKRGPLARLKRSFFG